MTFEAVWENILRYAGQEFLTKKGLPFTYQVIDDAVVISRTNRPYPLSKSQFERASKIPHLIGPGQINNLVRGSAYIYAILTDPRIRQ